MTAPRLLVATPLTDAAAERAVQEFGAILSQARSLTGEEILAAVRAQPVEALAVSARVRFDAAMIAALPASVKVLSTVSVGHEHIDARAAAARGLVVTNTPDVLTDATADLTLLLILGACRRAAEYMAIMQSGWGRRYELNEMLGIHLGGRTLGIFGMGRIGRAVAHRARAFGLNIAYHNRTRLPPELEAGATWRDSFEALLAVSDILSLHAPGGPATDAILDQAAIERLPKGAVVVNAARGALVDEDALIAALQSGRIAAAGLDVFRNEPDYDPRFKTLPNVFATPHMGSATGDTRDAMGMRTLDNIAAVLAGRAPLDPVLPQ